MSDEKLRVIHVEPGKRASVIEIEDKLEAMQKLVGGMIEEYMPWEDDVAVICNDEGKMLGLPLNRGIRGEDGQLQDIIAGDFFLCYAPIESERFLSLPPELAEKYKEKFYWPEQVFMKNGEGLVAHKYNPDYRKHEVQSILGDR